MTNAYRKDFPLLMAQDIAYLDNAATAQRPQCVIDAESSFYRNSNANPLRGLYSLSVEATEIPERVLHGGDHFHSRHHRGAESGGVQLWPSPCEGGRRGAGVHYGAPQ